MKTILLSNDDGYLAPGIRTLKETLSQQYTVTTVAPDRNRSGASNSLTLDLPLRVEEQDPDFYSVTGTPTDCVHLGTYQLMPSLPDIVVSGINRGANLGDDVHYSGTVAAAMEGRSLGFPSVAVSLAGHKCNHYDTAAKVVMRVLERLRDEPLPPHQILNINVPDIPFSELKGFQLTRLGSRHRADTIVPSKDPKGRNVYWIGPSPDVQDDSQGTDFYAVENGYVSLTPLLIDVTAYDSFKSLGEWMSQL